MTISTLSQHTPLLQSLQCRHGCVTFLAGDTDIQIVLSFTYHQQLGLISRTVGPFHDGIDIVVPMWLALFLRKKHLCKLIAPQWMDVEHLQRVLEYERDPNESSFSNDLPH